MMDVKTAADVILVQATQLNTIAQQITILSDQIDNIAGQEIGVPERVKAVVASLDIQVNGARSQIVLLQQAIDALSGLL